MRRRARRIRRAVVALTAALLCSAFLFLYVQLASGHDPALSAKAKRSATGKTLTTADASSANAQTSTSEGSSSGESSSGVSPVTTSQS
jgi:hypothetical protein